MTSEIQSASAKQNSAATTDRTELSLEMLDRVAAGFVTYTLSDVKITTVPVSGHGGSEPVPTK